MRNPTFLFDTPTTSQRDAWFLTVHNRIAAAVLAFFAMILLPLALYSSPVPTAARASGMACGTIDWRVGEKLAALGDRPDGRTRAIVNAMAQQRATARAHCQAGRLDEAMTLYSLTDRALTRYVSYGTAATLPK